MRDYLKKTKPAKIEDLIVLNALYRPGPLQSGMADIYVNRKLGREKVTYIFPELEEILKDTYGIIVFQEQVMQISVRIAGFSMSEADETAQDHGQEGSQQDARPGKKVPRAAASSGATTRKRSRSFSAR